MDKGDKRINRSEPMFLDLWNLEFTHKPEVFHVCVSASALSRFDRKEVPLIKTRGWLDFRFLRNRQFLKMISHDGHVRRVSAVVIFETWDPALCSAGYRLYRVCTVLCTVQHTQSVNNRAVMRIRRVRRVRIILPDPDPWIWNYSYRYEASLFKKCWNCNKFVKLY